MLLKGESMEYIKLNNGMEMPKLGYGTFRLKGEDCAQAVADAIDRLLHDAGLRDRLQANLRETAQGNEKELINYLHLQMGD